MNKRNAWLSILGGVGVALGALFGINRGGVIRPATAETHLTVLAADGSPLAAPLTCRLHIDSTPATQLLPCSYNGTQAVFVIPAAARGQGADLDLAADGFAPLHQRLELVADVPDQARLARVSVRLFPAEHGLLHIEGEYFKTADGQVWDWRGATMFTLPCRLWRGEDITPQIQWMQRHGVNVARVFIAGVSGSGWQGDLSGCGRPWEQFGMDGWKARVRAFNVLLADAGLRVENTVVTDDDIPAETYLKVLQGVYDALDGLWNPFVEYVNEPWVNNRQALLDRLIGLGVHRRGILSAYGTQPPGDKACECYRRIPVLDYVTPHSDRDLVHFGQNPKELLERRDVLHVPVIDDEPLGYADFDRTGGGARTTDRNAMATHFAVARQFGAGATAHSQHGLEGVAPAPDSISEQIMSAISAVWQFVPGDAQTAPYLAPHITAPMPFPLQWSNADSAVHHAYAKPIGDRAWAVNISPTVGWQAIGANGWTVDTTMTDFPFIVRLRR